MPRPRPHPRPRRGVAPLAALALLVPAATQAQQAPPVAPPAVAPSAPVAAPGAAAPTDASKFYLDYNVPESPAFALLGVTPATVLRGAASKPAIVSLASDLASGARLAGGVALDVAPYSYAGRFRNVDEYRRSGWKRFLANALVSLATTQAPGDTGATAFAAGGRVTFHDDHDLLANSALQQLVGRLLVPREIRCRLVPGTNLCQAGAPPDTVPVDVGPAYAAARAQVAGVRGWALSAGGAFGGTLRGGVPRGDSLQARRSQAWLAGTRYLGAGHELLGMAQWVRDTARADRLRAGAAYRRQTASSAVAAELAYDSGAGGVLPGANAEVRILPRLTLVAAVVTDVPVAAGDRKQVRFKTSLRWAAAEGF